MAERGRPGSCCAGATGSSAGAAGAVRARAFTTSPWSLRRDGARRVGNPPDGSGFCAGAGVIIARGTHVFRFVRMIAAMTIGLGAASALAEESQPNGKPAEVPAASAPAAGAAPPAPAPSAAPAQPAAPAASAPPVQGAAPAQGAAPVLPTGTPATVLDTADYEGVLGKAVRSANGEDMGRIIDIILDKDGRPRAAIIDFGGFLGVGSRKIAVDWRAMRFTHDGKPTRLVLQLTRNQVRVSPEYKPGDPIVVLGPASPAAPEGEQPAAAAPAPVAVQAPAPVAPTPPAAAPVSPTVVPPEKPPEGKPPERTPDR